MSKKSIVEDADESATSAAPATAEQFLWNSAQMRLASALASGSWAAFTHLAFGCERCSLSLCHAATHAVPVWVPCQWCAKQFVLASNNCSLGLVGIECFHVDSHMHLR